jgi:hypothetical protein
LLRPFVPVSIQSNSQYDERDMRKPIHITGPCPTPEDLAKRFPVSKASEKAIQAIVNEFKAQLSPIEEASAASMKPEKRPKRASAA